MDCPALRKKLHLVDKIVSKIILDYWFVLMMVLALVKTTSLNSSTLRARSEVATIHLLRATGSSVRPRVPHDPGSLTRTIFSSCAVLQRSHNGILHVQVDA